jgi:hypothetical protein
VARATNKTPLPTIGATLFEHPGDPMRLAAYLEVKGKFTSYVRDKSGTFKAVSMAEEPVVSPGGDWVALNPWAKFQNSDMDHIKFIRPSTGETFTVATVKKPKRTMNPVWSRDGTKLLLSVIEDPAEKLQRTRDFVLIDLPSRKATHVETEYSDTATLIFTFTPDGTIARGFWDGKIYGIDYYNTSGQVTKSMHWVGMPRNRDWFSPSGRQFITVCPKQSADICVWDATTGARRATIHRPTDEGHLIGWFNESHILMQEPAKKKGMAEIRVISFVGKIERVLAEVKPLHGMLQFAPVPR